MLENSEHLSRGEYRVTGVFKALTSHQLDEPRAVLAVILVGAARRGGPTNRPLPRGSSSRPMVARLVRYGPVRQKKTFLFKALTDIGLHIDCLTLTACDRQRSDNALHARIETF